MKYEIKKLIENNIDLIDAGGISTLFLVATNHNFSPEDMIELIVVLESADIKTYDARVKALDTLLMQLFALTKGVKEANLHDFLSGNLKSRFAFISSQIYDHIKSNMKTYSKWIEIEWDNNDDTKNIIRWKS